MVGPVARQCFQHLQGVETAAQGLAQTKLQAFDWQSLLIINTVIAAGILAAPRINHFINSKIPDNKKHLEIPFDKIWNQNMAPALPKISDKHNPSIKIETHIERDLATTIMILNFAILATFWMVNNLYLN